MSLSSLVLAQALQAGPSLDRRLYEMQRFAELLADSYAVDSASAQPRALLNQAGCELLAQASAGGERGPGRLSERQFLFRCADGHWGELALIEERARPMRKDLPANAGFLQEWQQDGRTLRLRVHGPDRQTLTERLSAALNAASQAGALPAPVDGAAWLAARKAAQQADVQAAGNSAQPQRVANLPSAAQWLQALNAPQTWPPADSPAPELACTMRTALEAQGCQQLAARVAGFQLAPRRFDGHDALYRCGVQHLLLRLSRYPLPPMHDTRWSAQSKNTALPEAQAAAARYRRTDEQQLAHWRWSANYGHVEFELLGDEGTAARSRSLAEALHRAGQQVKGADGPEDD